MRMPCLGGLLLAAVVCGCGHPSQPTNEETPPATTPPTARLGDKVGVSLAKWLTLPRPELAKLADEWTQTVEKQQLYARENPESVDLLPKLRPSLHAPVFRQAKFSPEAGFSIPPYYRPHAKDAALALHLARYGDRDAALKVADSGDEELQARLDLLRVERNYPAEWTRLVGLALHAAKLKLAAGDVEGATELVLLHRQLREVLGPRAAASPLGAALLPVGHRALKLAVEEWRGTKHNKKELAADVEKALKDWGTLPRSEPGLAPGAPAVEVARAFGVKGKSPVMLTRGPEATQRALDLLDLPVPSEGALEVVAFLNPEGRLADLLLVYRRRINEVYPEPAHLAHRLLGQGDTGRKPSSSAALRRQTYVSGGLAYDFTVVTQGDALGALVRVRDAKAVPAAPAFTRDPRDFGAAHLDRSFEEHRAALAPEKGGHTVTLTHKKALGKVQHPAAEGPQAVVLKRAKGQETLAHLRLRWAPDLGPHALEKLLLPLWSAYGNARIEEAEDEDGGSLLLTWENADTRVRLRLPHDGNQPPELTAEDVGARSRKEVAETALRQDQAARKARLAAGRPQARLSRAVTPMEGFRVSLGMSRKEADKAVPRTTAIRRLPTKDGLNVLLVENPPETVRFWPRQVFIRFGPNNRVAELRVRYQEGLKPTGANPPTLLKSLSAWPHGAPESLPAPWVGLWPDLPKLSPSPALYRWRDDNTIMTCQRDGGGAEVIIRDRPADLPLGVELPPLVFCPRGIENSALGSDRADVLKAWKVEAPTKAGDAEVLPMPEDSPYDAVLFWTDKGKVVRIVARHREAPKAAEVGAAMQKAWSDNIDHLGFLRRQDGRRGPILADYGWHDDLTRVRTFAQDSDEGPRLFTEWREWPVRR